MELKHSSSDDGTNYRLQVVGKTLSPRSCLGKSSVFDDGILSPESLSLRNHVVFVNGRVNDEGVKDYKDCSGNQCSVFIRVDVTFDASRVSCTKVDSCPLTPPRVTHNAINTNLFISQFELYSLMKARRFLWRCLLFAVQFHNRSFRRTTVTSMNAALLTCSLERVLITSGENDQTRQFVLVRFDSVHASVRASVREHRHGNTCVFTTTLLQRWSSCYLTIDMLRLKHCGKLSFGITELCLRHNKDRS